MNRESVGAAGQWFAAILIIISLAYEIASRADIGYIGITLGSFLYAAFTKLRKG